MLDFARWKLGEGEWKPRTEVLQVDQAIRQTLGLTLRGGYMVQPWHRRKYESAPPILAQITLALEFEAEEVPDGPLHLCLECPENWRILLNGMPISSETWGWWVDTAFQKIRLPREALNQGHNELILSGNFGEETNIEAVYLTGTFGVRMDGLRQTLTRLPNRLTVGDITAQGLPFYGGPLTFHVPIPMNSGTPLFIALPEFEAACAKVGSPHGSGEIISWPPYRAEVSPDAIQNGQIALDLVLTRRNTFGPLHEIPLRAGAYGPGSFVTRGEKFSEEYMLYPSGLLQAPVISWADKQ